MNRISEKRLKKLGGKVPFSSIQPKPDAKPKRKAGAMGALMQRQSKPRKSVKRVNAKRKAKEFARCYHSQERVLWVKSLPCAASGIYGTETRPIENAHVIDDGTKGAGRKSGFACIAPLLADVHRLLHDEPDEFRLRYPNFDAAREAERIARSWLSSHPQSTSEL